MISSASEGAQTAIRRDNVVLDAMTRSDDAQLATEFAIETIAKHPIQGHFAAVLVHQQTNAMVCSASLVPLTANAYPHVRVLQSSHYNQLTSVWGDCVARA